MDLAWLEDFLALAERGHFSRAAEARRLTQPAFSRRIQALEQWVGADLVDRATQPVALTEAGRRFHAAAAETLRRLDLGRDEARAAAGNAAAAISFAATFSLSLTFFPRWLRGLEHRLRPGPTRLVSDTRDECERSLAEGRVQFLLCHGQPGGLDPRRFRAVTVGTDSLVPVSAPAEGGRPRYGLPGTAGAPLSYLAYSAGSGLGQAVAAALAVREAWLEERFVSHLASVLLSVARDGSGVAWLPASLAEADLAAGLLVPAGDPSWSVPLDIRLIRPRTRLSPAAEQLWHAAVDTECMQSHKMTTAGPE